MSVKGRTCQSSLWRAESSIFVKQNGRWSLREFFLQRAEPNRVMLSFGKEYDVLMFRLFKAFLICIL